MSAEDLPIREFQDALRELDAARTGAQRGRKAWDTAETLTTGVAGQPMPPAAAAALERAKAFGDYEDILADAIADAQALLERTVGLELPLRSVLAEAVEEATAAEAKESSTTEHSRRWLRTWQEVLSEPEPEGGDWLVEDLLGKQSLGAIQGFAKTAKTWVVLELATSIVTGRAAFGRFEVLEPGPVIVVLEESPPRKTRERLDALARGHNRPQGAPGLFVSSNEHVRLGPDDDEWRAQIRHVVKEIRPRGVFVDPLVRIKGEDVDENEQKEIAGVLHFLADLRDEFACTTVYTHHTGHADKRRFRGSSDIEAFWSDKLALEASEKGRRHLQAFHRDAPPSERHEFRLAWRPESQTMRIELVGEHSRETDLREKLLTRVRVHPGESGSNVAKAVGGRKQNALEGLRELSERGQLEEHDGGWYLPSGGGSRPPEPLPLDEAVPAHGNRPEPEPPDSAPQSGKRVVPAHGNRPEPGAQEGGSRGDTPYGGNHREPTGPDRGQGTTCENGRQGDLVDTVAAVLAHFPGTREEVA